MRKLLIIALGILAVPLSAFPQTEGDHNRIIHGFSASYLLFPLDNSSDDVHGIGVNYDFSMPIAQSRFHFRTGIGFSHSYHKEDPNIRLSFPPTDFGTEFIYTDITNLTDYFTIKEYAEEYYYLSIPINMGFRLLDKKGFTVSPYLGISMKYNLSLVEKRQCDCYYIYDLYLDYYDNNMNGKEARRFMFQYNFGLEIGYKHFYGTASYERDFNSLLLNDRSNNKLNQWSNLISSDALYNWRFGLGFRF